MRAVLGPKLLGETVWEYFDFTSKLASGDSIVSAVVTCTTYSGVDPDATALLLGSPINVGGRIKQLLTLGLVGVVYQLQCQVTTTLGQTPDLVSYYVVLPADEVTSWGGGIPNFILTSLLYPSVVTESLDVVHAFAAGEMFSWLPDNLDVTHAFTAGLLLSALETYSYWPTEKLDVTHAFTAGTLTVVLLTYSYWPTENIDVTHAFTAGTLTVVLLTYSNGPVESLDITHAFIAGTLT